MTKIAVTSSTDAKKRVPVLDEISRRLEAVRQRAFERFERRGRLNGFELDDWLAAEKDVLGWPAAELKEQDGEFEMEVSLAGFAPSEIEVVAADDEVVVHAATRQQSRGEDHNIVWTEFGANDVYRRVALPEVIDTKGVTARYDNGLLRIRAPKATHASH